MSKKLSVVHQVKKVKLKPKQFELIRGTADAHKFIWDESEQRYVQTIRIIRGLAKALDKAKKFVLMVDTNYGKRLYVKFDGFTYNINEALAFARGFDNPETRIEEYQIKTKLKLVIKHL